MKIAGMVMLLLSGYAFAGSAMESRASFQSEAEDFVVRYTLVETGSGLWTLKVNPNSCSKREDGRLTCTQAAVSYYPDLKLERGDGPTIPERVAYSIGDTGYSLVYDMLSGEGSYSVCGGGSCVDLTSSVLLQPLVSPTF